MATKLNLNSGGTDIGNKIVDIHQNNEYTKVNNYKEGVCFGCFGSNVVGALVADVCGDCAGKKGREPLLVSIKPIYYGMCHFCGIYKFNMEQVNCRLCQKCHRKTANHMKEYNKKGGMHGSDPFWISMRRKHGKDWKQIMSNGTKSWRQ